MRMSGGGVLIESRQVSLSDADPRPDLAGLRITTGSPLVP